MLSIQLAAQIDALLGALGADSYFMRSLSRPNEGFSSLPNLMKTIAGGANGLASAANSMNSVFASFSRTREISARQFFSSLESLRSSIERNSLASPEQMHSEMLCSLTLISSHVCLTNSFESRPRRMRFP